MFLGIDLGARGSGNTAVCQRERGLFRFHRSTPGADGDAWLNTLVAQLAPVAIYIDAPLSLPGAYFGRGHDHFFRSADRQAVGKQRLQLGATANWRRRCPPPRPQRSKSLGKGFPLRRLRRPTSVSRPWRRARRTTWERR
mgnify:CR=1 FL=1